MCVDKQNGFDVFTYSYSVYIEFIYVCMIYIYHTFKNPRINSVTTEKKTKNKGGRS